ncbi:protein of unknown function [Burkholderia multivorans]
MNSKRWHLDPLHTDENEERSASATSTRTTPSEVTKGETRMTDIMGRDCQGLAGADLIRLHARRSIRLATSRVNKECVIINRQHNRTTTSRQMPL